MTDPTTNPLSGLTNTPKYRVVVVQSLGLGLFTGLFGAVYLAGVDWLTDLIWGSGEPGRGWFTGNLTNLVIPIGAGVAIGVVYKVFDLPSRFPQFIDDLQDGEVEPKTAPGALGVAVLSLISGPSLGPESPMGTAGGAAGTWLARHRGADADGVRQLNFIGISGAFGGLMSTPIGGPLLAFELEHDQTHNYYYSNLVPGVIAGAVAFGVMWPIVGAPFDGLLEIPKGEFKSWMLAAAAGLGVVGAIAAAVVGKIMVGTTKFFHRLDERPVIRGAVSGVGIGVISLALPLTMFSGQTTLPVILNDFASFGIPMLLALALFKAATLGISLGGGFFGGPIFPMFFIGGCLGVAVHLLVPAIPLSVAVGSIMASLGAAVALLPLSMAVLTAIMIQSGLEVFGAVVLAAVTAFAIRIGLDRRRSGDMQQSMTSGNE